MKFDLVRPCKYCPFRNDETRIAFQCRSRAEDIAETAYRFGFPCHATSTPDNETYLEIRGHWLYDEKTGRQGFVPNEKKEQR